MKRATRVRIMLIIIFACLVYLLSQLQLSVETDLIPESGPADAQRPSTGPQDAWPADGVPAGSD